MLLHNEVLLVFLIPSMQPPSSSFHINSIVRFVTIGASVQFSHHSLDVLYIEHFAVCHFWLIDDITSLSIWMSGVFHCSDMVTLITSGPVLALEVQAENALQRLLDLVGPSDAAKARLESPSSLRARYGTGTWLFCCIKVKSKSIAVCETSPHRYGKSLTIWDHTVLPATRQR